ncbi:PLP-dependent aminotransferase family protein [Dyadobacter chenwenxiniae]|uniref:PLP-dependent aminotransferase family protein n=1 Tax=Dyadobacter chenwenxiniae TaxID=2906456 RepID=A0A9X1TGD1_9BACT|nr:PLP-dependent aminotransferase family protein [Dyadobacter chenwenxiniae]MCF0063490.1 PLP-dependent aminotransferase family protein [Dyadobacter chenwenxiniae]UON85131.1 PLP-dependent aminotransferase family protein [Dyadobacter chenwenxiniae]
MQTNSSEEKDDFLYNQIAERLEHQIENNTLKAGDKLISLRAVSKEQGISLSTAYKAYVALESKGYVEARPKSGYFVRYKPAQRLKKQSFPLVSAQAATIDVDEMIRQVYRTLSREGMVRLSVAVPPVELIPVAKLNKALMEAIRQSPESCTQYEEIPGNLNLRKQIARYAFNWGGNVTADDIITTHGCMEAVAFCLKAVTEPGDTIAIESPVYFGIFNVIKMLGLKIFEVPSDPQDGPDIDFLEKALETVRIKACLFVPNFSNPTGALMPDYRKKQLVEMLAVREIPLIEDDIYGEMYFGKSRPKTCKSFDKNGLVMLCSSISKTLAPGYRVGWCIPGKFWDKVISNKITQTVSSATPTHAAIGNFFETGRYDLHMRNLRKALHTQSLRYMQAITEHFPPETQVSRPQGGYVFWIELDPKINAFKLFEAAILQNVSIAPGQIFSTDARFTNYIRISFGSPFTAAIDAGLKRLGALIKSLEDLSE